MGLCWRRAALNPARPRSSEKSRGRRGGGPGATGAGREHRSCKPRNVGDHWPPPPESGGAGRSLPAGPRGGVARRALTVAPGLGGHNVLSRAAGLGAAVAAACGTSVARRGSGSSGPRGALSGPCCRERRAEPPARGDGFCPHSLLSLCVGQLISSTELPEL